MGLVGLLGTVGRASPQCGYWQTFLLPITLPQPLVLVLSGIRLARSIMDYGGLLEHLRVRGSGKGGQRCWPGIPKDEKHHLCEENPLFLSLSCRWVCALATCNENERYFNLVSIWKYSHKTAVTIKVYLWLMWTQMVPSQETHINLIPHMSMRKYSQNSSLIKSHIKTHIIQHDNQESFPGQFRWRGMMLSTLDIVFHNISYSKAM